MTTISVPNVNSPLVDPTTGRINPPWFRFFQGLFSKTGSSTAAPLIAGNNLNDVESAASARGNLGCGSAATLAADTDGTLAANSDTRVATQKATRTYVGAAISAARFKGLVAMPAAGAQGSAAHGLGAVPAWCGVTLHCLVAEGNWSIGDEPGAAGGVLAWADTTTAYALVASTGITVLNKTTGASLTITPANWELVLHATL